MHVEKKQLTDKEYRALPQLSASDLRLFCTDLKKFYKKNILGEIEEEEYNRSLLIGTLVHCLLLEPDTFDSKFYISQCEKVPTGKMLEFVEILYRKTVENMNSEGELTVTFEELARMAHEESSFEWKLDTILKKFAGSEAESYYKQLREANSKGLSVVCMDDINIANRIVEIAKNHPYTSEILNAVSNDKIQVFDELQLESFHIDGCEMKMKLDKIIVNHVQKTIQLYDIKIVYDVNSFYYNYFLSKRADIQAFVYHQGLMSGKLDLGFDYSDYEILFPIFVAIDSQCFYAPVLYQLTAESMDNAYNGFKIGEREYIGVKEILENIEFCKENNIWNTTKESFDNNGIVKI